MGMALFLLLGLLRRGRRKRRCKCRGRKGNGCAKHRSLLRRRRVQAMNICKHDTSVVAPVHPEQMQKHKGPSLLLCCYYNEAGWKFLLYDTETGELVQSPAWLPSGFNSGAGVASGLLMGCMCCSQNLLLDKAFVGDLDMPRLASSGSFTCALLTAADQKDHVFGNVVVFDHLTGSARMLAPPLHSDLLFRAPDLYNLSSVVTCPCHIYMAVDELDPTHYYVMLSRVQGAYLPGHFSTSERHTEVFDSKTGTWRDATIWKEFEEPVDSFLRQVWEGHFFFICETHNNKVFRLVSYNVENDTWSMQMLSSNCSGLIRDHESFCIYKYEGRIFLAIYCTEQNDFIIWEVKQASSRVAKWTKIVRIPLRLLSDINNSIPDDSYVSVGILAAGNSFYFVIYVDNVFAREIPPLVYDIASDSWYFLPLTDWCSNYYAVLVHQPISTVHV